MRQKKAMPWILRRILFKKSDLFETASKFKTLMRTDKKKVFKILKNNQQDFPNEIALAVIVKNEGAYLSEWIEYHRLIGVTKFYIYDNDSDDNLDLLLSRYVEKGIVTIIKIHGEKRQLDAYEDAIEKAQSETKWLGVIDADEFIYVKKGYRLIDILEKYHHVGMLIGWMIFGSSGYTKKTKGLVIERFTHRANDQFIADYKMIFNPRKALRFKQPHYVQMFGNVIDENGKRVRSYPYVTQIQAEPASKNLIRINHYYTKSLSEFEQKSKRGYADYSKSDNVQRVQRSISDFQEHDRNEVFDDSMSEFVPKIYENIEANNIGDIG